MNETTITIKIRKATGLDFKNLRKIDEYKEEFYFKVAFPYFKKTSEGFLEQITPHNLTADFKQYIDQLKLDINAGLIYVHDMLFDYKKQKIDGKEILVP
jgi:hypothetical protein